MSRWWPRVVSIGVGLALLGCSSSTEPAGGNVDFARGLWLTRHPRAYTFEVATASSWVPSSGYVRVRVSEGQVVEASDPSGKPIAGFTLTIDGIWSQLLAARERGELNSAVFDGRGVPVESDMGPWPVDGGMHYSVRNFAASR